MREAFDFMFFIYYIYILLGFLAAYRFHRQWAVTAARYFHKYTIFIVNLFDVDALPETILAWPIGIQQLKICNNSDILFDNLNQPNAAQVLKL